VCHRDLKPENLLITKEDHLKIADFGVSQAFEADDTFVNNMGTKNYYSPEIWENKAFKGRPADI